MEREGRRARRRGRMSRTFPGAITAIFSILKPRMSAENAPVFAMFVRLQNKQNEPAGGLEVAWGLFWARK